MTTEVIPSVSIANLVQQRDAVLERIVRAEQLLQEADAIARAAPCLPALTCVLRTLCGRSRWHLLEADAVDNLRAILDSQTWGNLMGQTGLRSFMD
jgi:hypothetical protein